LLGSKLQSEDPNGFAIYQMTFYMSYNLFICGMWFLIQYALAGLPIWHDLHIFLFNVALQELDIIRMYGPDFILSPASYDEAKNNTWVSTLRAQEKIDFLWQDIEGILAVVVPLAAVQVAGLMIIYVGGVKFLGYLKHIMYLQVMVSATFVFLLYLLNYVINVDGLVLTTFFAPSLFFQFITTFYAWQSDIMVDGGSRGKMSTWQGRIALIGYLVYAAILYMFAIGMAMTISAAVDPTLGDAAVGVTLLTVSGICIVTVLAFALLMLFRFLLTRILAQIHGG